jgi:AAA15 family ATPase/GTPase
MILRPLAFQIWNYKSIQDSGICTLSGDGITVLAGQNEAGKTSVIKALNDFNTAIGQAATSKDYIPDHAPDSTPKIGILFQIDFEKFKASIKDAQGLVIDPEFLRA